MSMTAEALLFIATHNLQEFVAKAMNNKDNHYIAELPLTNEQFEAIFGDMDKHNLPYDDIYTMALAINPITGPEWVINNNNWETAIKLMSCEDEDDEEENESEQTFAIYQVIDGNDIDDNVVTGTNMREGDVNHPFWNMFK